MKNWRNYLTPSYAEVPLWQGTLFIRQNKYSAADLFAEKFILTNVTNKPMVLSEQEFYKTNVLAVSIKKMYLNPREQTEIYIISSGGQR